jgi:hypothetical protein
MHMKMPILKTKFINRVTMESKNVQVFMKLTKVVLLFMYINILRILNWKWKILVYEKLSLEASLYMGSLCCMYQVLGTRSSSNSASKAVFHVEPTFTFHSKLKEIKKEFSLIPCLEREKKFKNNASKCLIIHQPTNPKSNFRNGKELWLLLIL